MNVPRRQFLQLTAGAAALSAFARDALAQSYPSRPVRWIVGFAPGGGNDIVARLMGQWLSERLGQPFIVDNRPGGGANIATEAVVNAAPDGYTLLMAGIPNATNAALYPNLKFNFMREIMPVVGILRIPNVMVVHRAYPGRAAARPCCYQRGALGGAAGPAHHRRVCSGLRDDGVVWRRRAEGHPGGHHRQ